MLMMKWVIHATLAEQKNVSTDQMMTVLIHVLNDAAYIHEQSMTHRAIQSFNILIVSRESMIDKLEDIALSRSLTYKALEMTLRESYLLSDYSADIWSIDVLILQYSLFNCWRAHTSKWSSRRNVECQVSRSTWQGLTNIVNFMLNPEFRNRSSITNCSTRFFVEQNRARAMKSKEAQLYFTNLDFLRLQTMISRVSISALPLLFEIELQIITIVDFADRLKARISQILISRRGFHFKEMARRVHYDIEKSSALILNALTALLEKFREITDWTNTIDLRRLQQYVEKAHLAEKSDIVEFLHSLDVIRRCSK